MIGSRFSSQGQAHNVYGRGDGRDAVPVRSNAVRSSELSGERYGLPQPTVQILYVIRRSGRWKDLPQLGPRIELQD
jgi:hypothetical protein